MSTYTYIYITNPEVTSHAYNELKYFCWYLPLLSAGQGNEQANPFFASSESYTEVIKIIL